MKNLIKQDNAYFQALASCSENIRRFLVGLNNGTALHVDFLNLENSSLVQPDGSIWRVLESVRTQEEQFKHFKKGRKVTYKKEIDGSGSNLGYRYNIQDVKVTDSSKIVTFARPTESFHEYGQAVDIVFRKFGYEITKDFVYKGKIYTIGMLDEFYVNSGILFWANECNLSWGGNWENLYDIAHFENKNFKIPENHTELYSNEIKNYNTNLDISNRIVTTNSNKNNSINIPIVATIGILSYLLLRGNK